MSEWNRGQTVGTVVLILEILSDLRYGALIDDLVEATGLCRRSVLRYVASMEASGLVVPPGKVGPTKGRYKLGPRMIELAKRATPPPAAEPTEDETTARPTRGKGAE